jgi:hypothetical protein
MIGTALSFVQIAGEDCIDIGDSHARGARRSETLCGDILQFFFFPIKTGHPM